MLRCVWLSENNFVFFLLFLSGFWALGSRYQICESNALPTEPALWPYFFFFLRQTVSGYTSQTGLELLYSSDWFQSEISPLASVLLVLGVTGMLQADLTTALYTIV